MEQKKSELLLGIDLGTSRTLVMSNRGAKAMISSVIGYPKDLIGMKLLGDVKAIGDDAVARRSYLDIFMPLENGVLKEASERDMQAARELLKHAVSHAQPDKNDKVCGIIGVPARASLASKGALLGMAREVMDMALVLSEPFMVAYHLGCLKNSVVVDIGAGTIDICGMKGFMPGPKDQVTILKGGNSIDEALRRVISEHHRDVLITTHLAKTIKENHSFIGDAPGAQLVQLRAEGHPVERDLTEEIRAACETILPDIVEQLAIIIAGFDPEDQEEALQNIYLAGGGSNIRGLDRAIEAQMKDYVSVKVRRVPDPDYAGCAGGLKLAMDLPPQYWPQLGETIGK